MSLIIDTTSAFLPPKRKATPSGWISFNAVCCHHNGDSMDKRQRGGIMINDGVSYHCFNCGFKASWQPGRPLSVKFKKLLRWMNVSDDIINKCVMDALRQKEDSGYVSQTAIIPSFIDKALPVGTRPLAYWIENEPEKSVPVLEYLISRGFDIDDYDWHWTDEIGFDNRVIVPFYFKGRCVGWTARLLRDGKIKYISEQQPGYVFNLDSQTHDRKLVLVTEGPLDAISIGGCAVMTNEIGAPQAALLRQLNREVVVVPDRDEPGLAMVKQAIDLGFSVSMPDWPPGIKDINDSVRHYGRLYTMWMIINSKESMALKIQLRMKKWLG